MTAARIDDVVTLADERRLAYAEYGDADGAPVLLFHGLPGSRLSWGLLPDSPFPRGLRLIAPDRPGYGRSDPLRGRTLLDWADDVAALADALHIDKFAVLGVSGGGPGALACAWKMPERLTGAGVVCSVAPPDTPGMFDGMSRTNRFFMRLARRMPWLSSLNVRLLAFLIRRNPSAYIDKMQYKLHDVDKAILARTAIHDMLVKDFGEALRGSARGMIDDMAANHGRPWGFALDEIRAKVRVWFCELDRSVPPAMGRYLSDTIPDSEAIFVADSGHLWILLHLDEVLTALVSD